MSKIFKTLLIVIFVVMIYFINSTEKPYLFHDFINTRYSTRHFADTPVGEEQLNIILQAGNNAPSARNSQPWHFTVVKNEKVIQDILKGIDKGNVLIIISGLKNPPRGVNSDFDCALATQNMFLVAQSLGLGSRIYTAPISRINSSMLKTLQIPNEYQAVSVLRVGYEVESLDAVSSASPRHSLDTKVIILD